jgi:spermidine synthase
LVTEVTLNHEFLMGTYNTLSERALVSSALDMHPGNSLQVLIGGLGLGYTAHEALQSDRVGHVDVVEFLPQMIEWLEKGLVPLGAELRSDPRLVVVRGDIYDQLSKTPAKKHDLILIDVDHAPDAPLAEGSSPFYGEAGLAQAKMHLEPGGVLAIWSSAEDHGFSDALRKVFSHVTIERVTYQNDLVDEEETDWLYFARD